VSSACRRRDWRLPGLLIAGAAVLGGGWWIDRVGTPTQLEADALQPASAAGGASALAAPRPAQQAELQRQFDRAVLLLHAKQYAPAAAALHQVLQLAPALPEAHVNMGFAMLGLQRLKEARDFFDSATALKPDQANAYYGLALAWEAAGDLPMATGAMRSYLHLARDERPEHLRRARAALWEWEQARAGGAPAR
jgi:tetratricopeptide (TPR) repeat protein